MIRKINFIVLFAFLPMFCGPDLLAEDSRKFTEDEFNSFLLLAKRGEVNCQMLVGSCYADGEGVAQDDAEAAKWFLKAAEQGDPDGQYRVGLRYWLGVGVPENMTTAAKWFLRAAENGHVTAQGAIGSMYLTGKGIEKNTEVGAEWIRRSAEQGLARAQLELGRMLYNGSCVPKNIVESVKWFRRAAEQGDSISQFLLGMLYFNGDGITKNETLGYMWLLLAAGQGEEPAKRKVAFAEQKLSRGEIARGQEMARKFTPRVEVSSEQNDSDDGITSEQPKKSGTGFFITSGGFFVTNNHVIENATKIVVASRLRTRTFPARIVKSDASNDFALLKAEGIFSALPVASSNGVKIGAPVVSVGFPHIEMQGFSPKFSKGDVASLTGASDNPRFFQVSLPIQPGNSGGALVDTFGNVIGVVAAKLDKASALASSGELPENVNYAIKSSFLLDFLESIPDIDLDLNPPNAVPLAIEDVASAAERASVLILVY